MRYASKVRYDYLASSSRVNAASTPHHDDCTSSVFNSSPANEGWRRSRTMAPHSLSASSAVCALAANASSMIPWMHLTTSNRETNATDRQYPSWIFGGSVRSNISVLKIEKFRVWGTEVIDQDDCRHCSLINIYNLPKPYTRKNNTNIESDPNGSDSNSTKKCS